MDHGEIRIKMLAILCEAEGAEPQLTDPNDPRGGKIVDDPGTFTTDQKDRISAVLKSLTSQDTDSETFRYWINWAIQNNFISKEQATKYQKERESRSTEDKTKQDKYAEEMRIRGEYAAYQAERTEQDKSIRNLMNKTIDIRRSRAEVERDMNKLYQSEQIDEKMWDQWWGARAELEKSKQNWDPQMKTQKDPLAKFKKFQGALARSKKPGVTEAREEGERAPMGPRGYLDKLAKIKTDPLEPEEGEDAGAAIQREFGLYTKQDDGDDYGDDWSKTKPTPKPIVPDKYATFRKKLNQELRLKGFDDFEIFGAGASAGGETLSSLEYPGALRVVGPDLPEWGNKQLFVNMVKKIAKENGFQVEEDRPPTRSHFMGKPTISTRGEAGYEEPAHVRNRPFLYIYQSYKTGWPLESDRWQAERAGVSPKELLRLQLPYRQYEDIDRVANTLTEDPHTTDRTTDEERVAKIIMSLNEFKILREEIKDASENNISIRRSASVPIKVVGGTTLAEFIAESKDGNSYVDILNCPGDIECVLDILIEAMIR
jgi:hypothetical protein